MFQCSASNEAGYITGYTWLRVKSKFFFLFFKNGRWNSSPGVGACADLVSDSVI